MLSFGAEAQEERKKELIYRVGAGPRIEGIAGLWTINLMNELSYYATPRFSIHLLLLWHQLKILT